MRDMNYFLANLFRDWKWWARMGLVCILTLDLVDFLSFAFGPPGYFNLWMVKITAGAALVGVTVYAVFLHRHEKKGQQLEILLPAFMAERRDYFEKMVAADPQFQTFCFDCLYYDPERRCCTLCLQNREIKTKLHPLDMFSYCLYWNLGDHPIMALTKRLVPIEKDKPAPQ
jgi:hypothetical protein